MILIKIEYSGDLKSEYTMERHATDSTLNVGLYYYYPLWLFLNFLISWLALLHQLAKY